MEVPRLSTAEASQPDLCVVASLPTPKHHFPSRIPTIDLWKENEWEERYRAATTPSQPTPAWLVAAMGTFIAAVLLRATFSPAWTITVAVLSGTVLSCYLLLKRRTINVLTNVSSDVDQVLPSLARIWEC